ncbi:MAG TPA: response regulator [Myxococcaceae bacterium]|nr:response regulator [Myxococcaceae bacterium]
MRRYLIVDDNRAFAENLAEILRDEGHEAFVAISGAEALRLVAGRQFDALITDMKMPVMGGAQLVHEIRRVDPGLAAIVITAYTGQDDLTGAKHEGILAVLPKPVPIPHLMSLLRVARRDGLVALVEDDLSLSDNLVEALRDHGFTSLTATSAVEVERLGGVRPFAALVDLRLPGSPQGEALSRLAERFRGLPIIVITGFPNLVPAVKSLRVFQKPFDTQQLLETLEHLHRPGASR